MGYIGKVLPKGGCSYAIDCEHVEAVFSAEADWLELVGDTFVHVPIGARLADNRQKPYCVLGSLALAFQYAGDAHAMAKANGDLQESVKFHVKDRLKFAAGRSNSYGYKAATQSWERERRCKRSQILCGASDAATGEP